MRWTGKRLQYLDYNIQYLDYNIKYWVFSIPMIQPSMEGHSGSKPYHSWSAVGALAPS